MALPMALATLGVGAMGWLGTHQQNVANRRIAGKQMAFQERMSSTAYQRQMADMEAAGINPIYGFGGGAPSSAGAGIPAQGEMVAAANSALSASFQSAQIKKLRQDTKLTKELTKGAAAEARIKGVDAKIVDSWYGNILRFFKHMQPAAQAAGAAAKFL